MRFCLFLIFCTTALFGVEHASVSAYALNMKTGKVLIDENSEKSLVPASCMKVVTTAAALEILGPESRFQTHLESDGKVENGVLQGNLVILGGGDPCLGSAWQSQIETWVSAVCAHGIKKIEGKVIGDASRWEKALAVPSWQWEDIGNYYGAGACALSFHENCYTLFFKPGKKEGDEASVTRTEPAVLNFDLQNEVKTGPIGSGDRASIYGTEFSQVQHLRGTIPLGVKEFAIKGAIPDPATFCAQLLSQALQKRGIEVADRQVARGSQRAILHTTDSPSLREIVYRTNQKSVNLYAEHLLKRIGEVVLKEGSTVAGTQAVTQFWKTKQIDLDGFNMVDGSGLSRKNLVTAKQLVAILQEMKKSENFPLLLESFPKRVEGVRAKSGSMSLHRSYAGYAGDIAFAIIINGCTDSKKMKERLDLFLRELTK